MVLPEEYIVSKFFELNYYPKYNRYNNTYQAGCCICREGKSLGKTRRCYYIPKNDNIYCHNCGWSSKPLTWIKHVTGKTDEEVALEAQEYGGEVDILNDKKEVPILYKAETLPKDSINLGDQQQLNFYKSNPIVSAALQLIKSRRLDTAVNRTDTLYLSLTDPVHKNRLVIPFKNEKGDIVFYQTRTIIPTDDRERPRYIGKVNEEKTLFNIDKISNEFKSVYVFEGPLNAFFTKNSVAVAGITEKGTHIFTQKQQIQADTLLKWYDRVWVLDSQWIDTTAHKKTMTLLDQGERVFLWPEKFGKKFKDFNDICIACSIDEIKHEFIDNNTFEGIEGIVRMSNIKI